MPRRLRRRFLFMVPRGWGGVPWSLPPRKGSIPATNRWWETKHFQQQCCILAEATYLQFLLAHSVGGGAPASGGGVPFRGGERERLRSRLWCAARRVSVESTMCVAIASLMAQTHGRRPSKPSTCPWPSAKEAFQILHYSYQLST